MMTMISKFESVANKYDFLNTSLLSEVPVGWLDLIDQMSSEIQEELAKSNIKDYGVLQTKEKYGELRWYDYNSNSRIDEIINKYIDISSRTCGCCGKPSTKISLGWIYPWCDECAEKEGGEFEELEEVKKE